MTTERTRFAVMLLSIDAAGVAKVPQCLGVHGHFWTALGHAHAYINERMAQEPGWTCGPTETLGDDGADTVVHVTHQTGARAELLIHKMTDDGKGGSR